MERVKLYGFYRVVLPNLQQKYIKYALSKEKFEKKNSYFRYFCWRFRSTTREKPYSDTQFFMLYRMVYFLLLVHEVKNLPQLIWKSVISLFSSKSFCHNQNKTPIIIYNSIENFMRNKMVLNSRNKYTTFKNFSVPHFRGTMKNLFILTLRRNEMYFLV